MSSTDHPDFRREFSRVGHYAKNTLGGFRTFVLRGNVVDLAIGIVIGAAFTSVVNSFVSDIITPLIPLWSFHQRCYQLLDRRGCPLFFRCAPGQRSSSSLQA